MMLCVYDFFKARILGDDPGEEVLLVFFSTGQKLLKRHFSTGFCLSDTFTDSLLLQLIPFFCN